MLKTAYLEVVYLAVQMNQQRTIMQMQISQMIHYVSMHLYKDVWMLQHVTMIQLQSKIMVHVNTQQKALTVMVIVHQEVQLQLICSTLTQMVVDQ